MKVKSGDVVTFVGVSWQVGWEFECSTVIYSPVVRYCDTGYDGVLVVVQEICNDLCKGEIDDDMSHQEAVLFHEDDLSLDEIEKKPGSQRIVATFFEGEDGRLDYTLEGLDAPDCFSAQNWKWHRLAMNHGEFLAAHKQYMESMREANDNAFFSRALIDSCLRTPEELRQSQKLSPLSEVYLSPEAAEEIRVWDMEDCPVPSGPFDIFRTPLTYDSPINDNCTESVTHTGTPKLWFNHNAKGLKHVDHDEVVMPRDDAADAAALSYDLNPCYSD